MDLNANRSYKDIYADVTARGLERLVREGHMTFLTVSAHEMSSAKSDPP